MAPICRTLGISRACAYRESVGRPARYVRADDRAVTAQIRTVIRTRASYGARRVWALVNREFQTGYNLKRIQRVMELNGWKLPRATRRRTGRAHRGLIQRAVSNERWCSDVLEIACWNGEIVQLGFALDCHDREALAHLAAATGSPRRGHPAAHTAGCGGTLRRGAAAGRAHSVAERQRQHLHGARHPDHRRAAAPGADHHARGESAVQRDVGGVCEHATAGLYRGGGSLHGRVVLDQIPAWIADYNAVAPHSALGYQSPRQYLSSRLVEGPKC